jgi:four helix bundle protein
MKDFKQLQVWQKAHALNLAVYRETITFPKEEMYGLTSQLRRAVSSVSANIAEGCGRGSDADFGRFLYIAMGSACESECHLLLARDLKFLDQTTHVELEASLIEVKRMLASLIAKVSVSKNVSYLREEPLADPLNAES